MILKLVQAGAELSGRQVKNTANASGEQGHKNWETDLKINIKIKFKTESDIK